MTEASNGHVTYRLLPIEEWDRLRELWPPDHPFPDPMVASAVVAEKNGKLLGALLLQLAMHMEPLVIADPAVNYMRMVQMFNEALPKGLTYYAFAPDAKIGLMAEKVGMRESVGWRVYSKEV